MYIRAFIGVTELNYPSNARVCKVLIIHGSYMMKLSHFMFFGPWQLTRITYPTENL